MPMPLAIHTTERFALPVLVVMPIKTMTTSDDASTCPTRNSKAIKAAGSW